MHSEELALDTSGGWYVDLTRAAADFCRDEGDGLLHVFVPQRRVRLSFVRAG